MRRPTMAIVARGAVERGEIEFVDDLQHEPRQVIVGQPLPQAGWQQQCLIAITRQEVPRHAAIVVTAPDNNRRWGPIPRARPAIRHHRPQ
jgi:hypothetical protein